MLRCMYSPTDAHGLPNQQFGKSDSLKDTSFCRQASQDTETSKTPETKPLNIKSNASLYCDILTGMEHKV